MLKNKYNDCACWIKKWISCSPSNFPLFSVDDNVARGNDCTSVHKYTSKLIILQLDTNIVIIVNTGCNNNDQTKNKSTNITS